MHLLKVVFGVESACETFMYTPTSPVPITKSRHTVNKKLNICQMDKTVKIQCIYIIIQIHSNRAFNKSLLCVYDKLFIY